MDTPIDGDTRKASGLRGTPVAAILEELANAPVLRSVGRDYGFIVSIPEALAMLPDTPQTPASKDLAEEAAVAAIIEELARAHVLLNSGRAYGFEVTVEPKAEAMLRESAHRRASSILANVSPAASSPGTSMSTKQHGPILDHCDGKRQ